MKTYLKLFFFVIILLISCKKDRKLSNPMEPISLGKIILNEPIVKEDTIKLTWSNLVKRDLSKLIVSRSDFDGANFYSLGEFTPREDIKEFLDVNVPYSPNVSYLIVGYFADGTNVFSDTVSYKREDIKLLNINPYDVIYVPEEKLLYFFESSGQISLYDLRTNEIIKQVQTGTINGFSDIEDFQGKKELYVPRRDGSLFIYDALTLDKIDQIEIGWESSSVVSMNNFLFVSTDDLPRQPLKVYKRSDKSLISKAGDTGPSRLIKIPNSNTKLLELSIGNWDQNYYDFNEKGELLGSLSDSDFSNNSSTPSIFAFFPNGQKYITSIAGAVFNVDLTYDKSLPRGNLEFTSFTINEQSGEIYGGTNSRTIEVYSIQSYEHLKTIKTKGFPFRIYDLDDGILSVSLTSAFDGTHNNDYQTLNTPNRVIIEKLK